MRDMTGSRSESVLVRGGRVKDLPGKSSTFAKKLGFYCIDGENYAIAATNLMSYFSME